MENEELKIKIELLSKSVWTYKDIMAYDTTIKSPTTAIKLKKYALDHNNGKVPYGEKYVLADAILKIYGTTREKELSLIGELYGNKQKK